MELQLLSFNFNRIIYILNKIFIDATIYKVTSTRVDKLNNQLDLFVDYEIEDNNGIYLSNQIVSIPKWLLEKDTNNKEIEYFINAEKLNIKTY